MLLIKLRIVLSLIISLSKSYVINHLSCSLILHVVLVKFNKVGYDNTNELILEYELIDDDKYKDTNIIKYYIGNYYYLSATQVLYAFNYIANS